VLTWGKKKRVRDLCAIRRRREKKKKRSAFHPRLGCPEGETGGGGKNFLPFLAIFWTDAIKRWKAEKGKKKRRRVEKRISARREGKGG